METRCDIAHSSGNCPADREDLVPSDSRLPPAPLGSQPSGPDNTRERLLEAAGEIFAAKGFHAATIREICAGADTNHASVSYYFGGKVQLYAAALTCALSDMPEAITDAPTPVLPPEQELYDALHEIIIGSADLPRPAWHRHLLLRELSAPTSACQPLLADYLRPRYERLHHIVERLVHDDMSPQERRLLALLLLTQATSGALLDRLASLLWPEQPDRALTDARPLAAILSRFSLAALCAEQTNES